MFNEEDYNLLPEKIPNPNIRRLQPVEKIQLTKEQASDAIEWLMSDLDYLLSLDPDMPIAGTEADRFTVRNLLIDIRNSGVIFSEAAESLNLPNEGAMGNALMNLAGWELAKGYYGIE